jgi:hypothetical protein
MNTTTTTTSSQLSTPAIFYTLPPRTAEALAVSAANKAVARSSSVKFNRPNLDEGEGGGNGGGNGGGGGGGDGGVGGCGGV